MEVHKDAKVITDASYRAAPAAPTTSSSSTSSGSSSSSSSTSVSAFSSSDEAAEVAAVLADKSELADMLKETIDALSAEIEEVQHFTLTSRILLLQSVRTLTEHFCFNTGVERWSVEQQ